MPQQSIIALDYANTGIVSSHPSSAAVAFSGAYFLATYNHPSDSELISCGPYRTPGGIYEVYEAFEAFDLSSINIDARVRAASITFDYQTISAASGQELLCCATDYPGTRVPLTTDYEDPRVATQYGSTLTDGYPSFASSVTVNLNSTGIAALQQAVRNSTRFACMVYYAFYDFLGNFNFRSAGVGASIVYYTNSSVDAPVLSVTYDDADAFLGAEF